MSKFVTCNLLLILAAPSLADNKKFDAEARARAVAPFLDEQTIAVGHLDLTRVDVDAIVGMLAEYGKLDPGELAGPKKLVGDSLAAWTKAGAREMFVVVSLTDMLGQPPFVVIPLEEGADAKAIGEALSRSHLFEHFKFEKIESAVVGGAEKSLARLKSLKPDNRPDLAKAFAAAGDTTVQAILIPTNENRRVVEEIMPKLPKELGGGPITILTRGILWGAAGSDLPPKVSVRVTVQSPDAASAQKLHDLAAQFLKLVGEEGPHNQKARDVLPGFDKLVEQLTPKVQEDRLTVTLDEKDFVATLKPVVTKVRDTAEVNRSVNNLKQILLATHNYHDAYRHFPTVANFDKAGKPLLSWRVHLLPFVDQVKLYKEFHLDEPWDSEHNKKLIDKMPAVYRSTKNKELIQAGKTTYLAPVGEHMMFTGTDKTLSIRDVTDGTSNTILMVDVDDDHAVIWTKPDDFKPDPKTPTAGLRKDPGKGYLIGIADGSVRPLPATIDPKIFHAMLTRDGGEVINWP
jgi:hypothetical protein